MTRSENETKPVGNESTPLGPSKSVGGESTFLDPTKPFWNEPTLPDPPLSESTNSIQPTQLKPNDQQASDPKTPSISSVPTASSTITIDLTILQYQVPHCQHSHNQTLMIKFLPILSYHQYQQLHCRFHHHGSHILHLHPFKQLENQMLSTAHHPFII